MKIKWHGNASIGIETETSGLVIDPFLELPGGENPNRPEDFARYQGVLLTHGHVDHLGNLPEIFKDRKISIACSMTPRRTLIRKGIPPGQIRLIRPGDRLRAGDLRIEVFRGRHIRFDAALVLHTLINPRVLQYKENMRWFAGEHLRDHENGETLAFLVSDGNERAFVLGSLGLDPDETYPQGTDTLILPFQGRTYLLGPALSVVERLQPKAVMLSHFDDAFPPVSGSIDTTLVKLAMKECFSVEVL